MALANKRILYTLKWNLNGWLQLSVSKFLNAEQEWETK